MNGATTQFILEGTKQTDMDVCDASAGAEQIKLPLNKNDKENIGAIKNPVLPQDSNRHANSTHHLQRFLGKVLKVKYESHGLFGYLSMLGVILILCSSVLFIGLWSFRNSTNTKRASGCVFEDRAEHVDDMSTVFHRHLTSASSVEEIRRITRNVLLEEMPRLLSAMYDTDSSVFLRYVHIYNAFIVAGFRVFGMVPKFLRIPRATT